MGIDAGTTQAQLFRDAYPQLQTAGLAVFGLSADSTKANTTFCTKQKLPYTLLCDTAAHLIRALGLHKHPNSTRRGVVVLDRSAVVQAYTQAGPAATLDAVQEWVKEHGGGTENGGDDVPAATAAKSGTDDAGKGGEDGTAKSDKLADAVGDAAAPAVEADAETKLKEDGPKAE